jgi:SEC-C motif-containing protein
MRSRYAAFAVGDADYLFRTWHPRTRPNSVVVDPALSWTGLEIADVVAGSERDEDGEVAFTARWCTAEGRRGVLVERSRFVRRAGRWLYLDGDHS